MWIWLLVILGSVILDQATKWLVVRFIPYQESVSLIDGVFEFTYIRNEGAAFGMLSDNRWVFMIVSTIAIGALLIYLWKFNSSIIEHYFIKWIILFEEKNQHCC